MKDIKVPFKLSGIVRVEDTQIHMAIREALMKMFNMIGIGERLGSGVPDIYPVWESQGWVELQVIEEYSPDRTILKLSFVSTESVKASQKSDRKTQRQKEIILSKMQPNMKYRVEEVAA